MAEFLEILKYILPSFIVFLTAYFMLQTLVKKENNRNKFKISQDNHKLLMPMRLQAYERFVLFLERISAESLILRIQENGMSVQDLQALMLIHIRHEYEHNLAQQIYISPKTWIIIKRAKESMIEIINTSAVKINNPNAPAFELSKIIFNRLMRMPDIPTNLAINVVKQEMGNIF